MARLVLDHLVYAAPTLEEGREAVMAALGVDVPMGGRHEGMATHNRLMGLGGDCYFEIIAPIEGETPARPPLFGLATPPPAPRLLTFVARTASVEAALETLGPELAPQFGAPVPMSRGDLMWTITQPDDGSLPMDGALPTLIAWPDGEGPAASLVDLGVRLASLTVRHPQAQRLAAALAPMFADPRIAYERGDTPSLAATFETPSGPRTLA